MSNRTAACDEVKTENLPVELIRVLQETMQPGKVVIWLKSVRKRIV